MQNTFQVRVRRKSTGIARTITDRQKLGSIILNLHDYVIEYPRDYTVRSLLLDFIGSSSNNNNHGSAEVPGPEHRDESH